MYVKFSLDQWMAFCKARGISPTIKEVFEEDGSKIENFWKENDPTVVSCACKEPGSGQMCFMECSNPCPICDQNVSVGFQKMHEFIAHGEDK